MIPENNLTDVETVYALLPIIILLYPILYIYYWIKGEPEYVNYDDYEPKEILQMRFAKGEINHLEYSFKMSRL